MSAFFLFEVRKVTDPDKLGQYKARVLDTVTAHGGRYRVLGGAVEVVEGTFPIATPVLIEFPDMASAQAWYASDAYGPVKALRQDAADCAACLLDGCDHPPVSLVSPG